MASDENEYEVETLVHFNVKIKAPGKTEGEAIRWVASLTDDEVFDVVVDGESGTIALIDPINAVIVHDDDPDYEFEQRRLGIEEDWSGRRGDR